MFGSPFFLSVNEIIQFSSCEKKNGRNEKLLPFLLLSVRFLNDLSSGIFAKVSGQVPYLVRSDSEISNLVALVT